MHLRGQYALEQMGVIALALVVIAALFFFSMNAASDGARSAQAKDTVERIARAADSAYSLGPGSKATVSVNMPQGVQFVDTSNKRVWMRVALSSGNTDVFAATSGQITGSIPTTANLQDITLTVLSNGDISVGRQSLSCSPSRFTKTIMQGGSASGALALFNSGLYAISGISTSISGVPDLVGASSPGSVPSGSSANISLSFSVPISKPVGTYTGALSVNGSNSTSCASSVTIFVTSSAPADILGPVVSGILATPSNITAITPATISATAADANNSIASCLLQLDSSGVWNAMGASDGAYSAGMETIAYYLGYLDSGSHTVGIYCVDSLGNAGSQASYGFSVSDAGGNATTDTQGPVVSNLTITAPSACTSGITVVNATASDLATGGNNVGFCQLQFNGGAPSYMDKQGGVYSFSQTINVSAQIGSLGVGSYNVSIQCTDVLGNAGIASNSSFSIVQSPLCVYARTSPNGTQSAPGVSLVNGYCLANSAASANISYFDYAWWRNGVLNASERFVLQAPANFTAMGNAAAFAYDSGFTSPANANDSSYASAASYAQYSSASMYWNYTNLANSTNQTTWQTRHGIAATANDTLPALCASQPTLQLRITSNNSNSTSGALANSHVGAADSFAYDAGLSNDTYANDNNYLTYAYSAANNTIRNAYWNYSSSLPDGLVGALWQVKHGTLAAYNISLSASCLAQYPMQLRMSSYFLNSSYYDATYATVAGASAAFAYDSGFTSPTNANDNSYSTKASYTAYSTASMYWNYTNLANSTNQTTWQTKHGAAAALTNDTLPYTCANQPIIMLSMVSNNSNITSVGGANYANDSTNTWATTSTGGTSLAWSNPTRAQASDSSYATVPFTTSGTVIYSGNLTGLSWGFAIPNSSIITGIAVRVGPKFSSSSAAPNIYDRYLYLLKNNAVVGDNKADTGTQWPVSRGVNVTYGDSSDLWGTTWSASDINNASFGVLFAAQKANTPATARTASVDYINITVFFNTTATTSYSQSSAHCWDGGAWVNVGADSTATNNFNASDIYEQDLFFNTSNATGIFNGVYLYNSSAACYNGTAWQSAGSISNGSAAQNNYLYDQGLFVNTSGNTTNYSQSSKFCWNGAAWAEVGTNSAATNNFSAASIYGQDLYFRVAGWANATMLNNTEYLVGSLNTTFASGQNWQLTCTGYDGNSTFSANSTALVLTG